MEINRKLVEHISRLCRIELNEEEINIFLPQLSEILSYIDKINSLNLDHISPSASAIEVSNVYHKDEPKLFPNVGGILKISFLSKDNTITVPAVIEKNGL